MITLTLGTLSQPLYHVFEEFADRHILTSSKLFRHTCTNTYSRLCRLPRDGNVLLSTRAIASSTLHPREQHRSQRLCMYDSPKKMGSKSQYHLQESSFKDLGYRCQITGLMSQLASLFFLFFISRLGINLNCLTVAYTVALKDGLKPVYRNNELTEHYVEHNAVFTEFGINAYYYLPYQIFGLFLHSESPRSPVLCEGGVQETRLSYSFQRKSGLGYSLNRDTWVVINCEHTVCTCYNAENMLGIFFF